MCGILAGSRRDEIDVVHGSTKEFSLEIMSTGSTLVAIHEKSDKRNSASSQSSLSTILEPLKYFDLPASCNEQMDIGGSPIDFFWKIHKYHPGIQKKVKSRAFVTSSDSHLEDSLKHRNYRILVLSRLRSIERVAEYPCSGNNLEDIEDKHSKR